MPRLSKRSVILRIVFLFDMAFKVYAHELLQHPIVKNDGRGLLGPFFHFDYHSSVRIELRSCILVCFSRLHTLFAHLFPAK